MNAEIKLEVRPEASHASEEAMSNTQTKADAKARVSSARAGFLADAPTQEYLVELRRRVAAWLAEINEAIVRGAKP